LKREVLKPKRRSFLARMFREAMKPYEHPREEWSEDEKEFLPLFMDMTKHKGLILDLGGGYGRVTPYLLAGDNQVVLADLSFHSLRGAQKTLKENVDFVRLDMLNLPFVESIFDGVWFTQAFEYVPPYLRANFLLSLRKTVKKGGIAFINVAKIPNEYSILSYVKNYIYWKFVKRQPVVWGEYIYKIDFDYYKGWHYHSEVLSRRTVEKIFRKVNFKVLKFKSYRDGYFTYLLEAH